MDKKNQKQIEANLKFLEMEDIKLLNQEKQELLNSNIKKIKKIISKSDEKKYNLVFIGDSGVGKSTVISSLLNFYMAKDDFLYQVIPADAGGRTTPCVIEISLSNKKYFIKVENESKESIETLLLSYLQEKSSGKGDLSEEYKKILDKKISKDIQSKFSNYKKEDITLESVQELNITEDMDDFYLEFDLKLSRNQVFAELKSFLEQIKLGKNQKILIPKKIIIGLRGEAESISEGIDKIIDTRGISSDDSGETLFCRKELEEYINDENNIIVYINKFATLNRRIRRTFETLSDSSEEKRNILKRILIIINSADIEIIEKISVDDVDDTVDELNVKTLTELVNKFNKCNEFNEKIALNEFNKVIKDKKESFSAILKHSFEICNLLMYRSLAGKSKDAKKIYVENEDDSLNELKRFNDICKEIMNSERERLQEELLTISESVITTIKDDKEAKYKVVKEFRKKLVDSIYREIEIFTKEYAEKIEVYLKGLSGRTIKAYIDGEGYVRSAIDRHFEKDIFGFNSDLKFELIRTLDNEKNDNIKLLKIDIDQEDKFVKALDNMASEFIDECTKKLFEELQEKLRNEFVGDSSREFWLEVKNEYKPKCFKYADSLNMIFKKYYSDKSLTKYRK